MSVHVEHAVRPPGHMQLPASHVASAGHALSHAPQESCALVTSAHAPAQHASPDPHALPHAPQFFGSLSSTTHSSPHFSLPGASHPGEPPLPPLPPLPVPPPPPHVV